MAGKKKSRGKSGVRAAAVIAEPIGPTKEELEKLRREIDKVTAGFFEEYGDIYDYMLVCPPGPIPPPKVEESILNLGAVG
jgi:hypothetical protein